MPVILLDTMFKSDIDTCFDLSRSIDLHQISTAQSKEKAVGGKTEGLIELNQFVTWQATHFGWRQNLTSIITAFERPFHFRDEQLKGPFKYFKHDHFFSETAGGVMMRDVFDFESPWGLLGAFADKLILTSYMKKLLTTRNAVLREYAESGQGKLILTEIN